MKSLRKSVHLGQCLQLTMTDLSFLRGEVLLVCRPTPLMHLYSGPKSSQSLLSLVESSLLELSTSKGELSGPPY